jgi:hypothetical protein
MSIEVVKFKPYAKGPLMGFADIFVTKMGLEVNGVSVFNKDGKKWVGMPSREYKNEAGETKYAPIIRFRDKNQNDKFCGLVLEAVLKAIPKEEIQCNNDFDESQMDLPF